MQIVDRCVEFLLGHFGVYRVGMGIPGDFHEIGRNCCLLLADDVNFVVALVFVLGIVFGCGSVGNFICERSF